MAWEVNPAVQLALGNLGTAAALVLFCSPLPTMRQIWSGTRAVSSISPLPYLTTLLNCGVWSIYALPYVTPHRPTVLITNLIGIVFESVYIALMLAKSSGGQRKPLGMKTMSVAVAILAMLAMSVMLPKGSVDKSLVVGINGDAISLAMYAAPLSVMGQVIRTKSAASMPLFLSVATLINAFAWAAYGTYVHDPYILLPNVPGVLLALFQLGLIWRYGSSKSDKAELTSASIDTHISREGERTGLLGAASHPTREVLIEDAPTIGPMLSPAAKV